MNYKIEQLQRKLSSLPNVELVKMPIPENQKKHYDKKGNKITLNRADRRDKFFKRGKWKPIKETSHEIKQEVGHAV